MAYNESACLPVDNSPSNSSGDAGAGGDSGSAGTLCSMADVLAVVEIDSELIVKERLTAAILVGLL